MGKPIYKDKIFQLFKSKFKVNLFYKPEADCIDRHYAIILDNILRIHLVLLGTNFLVIDGIIPLTTGYMPKTYELLLDCLIDQKDFTILIQKLSDVSVINDACIKRDVPIVVDERFITIPKKLYTMYMRYYKNNETDYGFYLLAVNSSLDDVPVKEELKETIVERPEIIAKEIIPTNTKRTRDKSDLANGSLDLAHRILSLFDTRTTLITDKPNKRADEFYLSYLNMIEVTFQTNEILTITNFTVIKNNNGAYPSAVDYMQLLESLEPALVYFPIIIRHITNRFVYDICKLRNYEYLGTIEKFGGHNMGSYKMIKYRK